MSSNSIGMSGIETLDASSHTSSLGLLVPRSKVGVGGVPLIIAVVRGQGMIDLLDELYNCSLFERI